MLSNHEFESWNRITVSWNRIIKTNNCIEIWNWIMISNHEIQWWYRIVKPNLETESWSRVMQIESWNRIIELSWNQIIYLNHEIPTYNGEKNKTTSHKMKLFNPIVLQIKNCVIKSLREIMTMKPWKVIECAFRTLSWKAGFVETQHVKKKKNSQIETLNWVLEWNHKF